MHSLWIVEVKGSAMSDMRMRIGKHTERNPNKDEQYTPKWLFDRMGIVFDLDVAAPIGGAPYVPAHRYYTKIDDGLAEAWEGLVFMNPPYSAAKLWVEKFIQHGNGIALLPFSKSRWFWELWESADAIVAIRNDLKFETPSKQENKIFMQVALFAYGDEAKNALSKAEISRVR